VRNYWDVRRNLSEVGRLDGVIVASRYMERRLQIGGVTAEQLHVLPYFVTTSVSVPELERERPERILFVGRLNETKGVDVLLTAFSYLPARYELVIVGDGYALGSLRKHAAALGLAPGRVSFLGQLRDEASIQEAYESAAVLALPSLWPEPFGIVGLESLSYGKPVVAFDVGGVADWCLDGEVGLLAAAGDAGDLAAKLKRLLEDEPLRRQLGLRGREWVKTRFSWERHWEDFSAILGRRG
jgi:glycosyltransferase involved in cell wall biosynthesis